MERKKKSDPKPKKTDDKEANCNSEKTDLFLLDFPPNVVNC